MSIATLTDDELEQERIRRIRQKEVDRKAKEKQEAKDLQALIADMERRGFTVTAKKDKANGKKPKKTKMAEMGQGEEGSSTLPFTLAPGEPWRFIPHLPNTAVVLHDNGTGSWVVYTDPKTKGTYFVKGPGVSPKVVMATGDCYNGNHATLVAAVMPSKRGLSRLTGFKLGGKSPYGSTT